MIDLKNKADTDSLKNKKAKIKLTKEERAKKFLCVMLSVVIVFVGVICICVTVNNKKIQKSKEADSSTKAITTQNTTNKASNSVSSPQAENTYPAVTVLQPGTVDNPTVITIDSKKPYLTLINSKYRLEDEYEPDLVYICNSAERLEKTAAQKYEEMYNAALKENIVLTPFSAYRTYEEQELKFNKKTDFFTSQGYSAEEANEKAISTILPPGSSEHNLGFSVDIICADESFEATKAFDWLQKNAANYGFVMRYPSDKQEITSFSYEPWHWRYVGVEEAQQMKKNNLTLEEYLGVAQ